MSHPRKPSAGNGPVPVRTNEERSMKRWFKKRSKRSDRRADRALRRDLTRDQRG